MYSEKERNSVSFMKGILLGSFAGAVTALFLAPKSGQKLRGDVKNRVSGLRDDAETKLNDAQKRVESTMKDLEKQIEEYQSAGRDTLEKIKSDAGAKLDDGKSRLSEGKGKVKKAFDAGVKAIKD